MQNTVVKSYKDLIVWQKAYLLAKQVYILTDKLPQKEVFGIQSQVRRASVSIASNIAEGKNRKTVKDFLQFLRIAYGSTSELETQLLLIKDIYKIESEECFNLTEEVSKMLRAMIYKLEAKS